MKDEIVEAKEIVLRKRRGAQNVLDTMSATARDRGPKATLIVMNEITAGVQLLCHMYPDGIIGQYMLACVMAQTADVEIAALDRLLEEVLI